MAPSSHLFLWVLFVLCSIKCYNGVMCYGMFLYFRIKKSTPVYFPPAIFPGFLFRVAISTAPDPQGTGRVDILTHPYSSRIACAAGVVTRTADKDS